MKQRYKTSVERDRVGPVPDFLPESVTGGDPFAEVRTFCLFVGYPRSGHSLVGALLDAHPNVIIGHELDALQYVAAGYSRNELYHSLLKNSQRAIAGGRKWGDYSYEVPHQWQGRFTTLLVIGDKKGGGSAKRLRFAPEILTRLRDTVGIPVKYIHVTRNPFDNISTAYKHKKQRNDVDLAACLHSYFARCQTIADVKWQISRHDFFEIKYETFVDDPRAGLRELCRFLGISAPADYLNDCASIVYPSTHRSRFEVPWPAELINKVEAMKDQFPFLQGYAY
jgi:hypothetical protein